MNPALWLALGAGAFIVWYTTRPGGGGIGELFGMGGGGGLTGEPVETAPPFTDEQLNYYLSGFATHLTGAQAAGLGANAGAPFAGVTFGISVGVGALAGWLSVRNSNDTREDREVFAKRLGFTPENGLGIHTQQTTSIDDKSKGLYSYLTFINRDDLRHTAMAVIGRKDFEGNVAWMVSVLGALYVAGFKFPR